MGFSQGWEINTDRKCSKIKRNKDFSLCNTISLIFKEIDKILQEAKYPEKTYAQHAQPLPPE